MNFEEAGLGETLKDAEAAMTDLLRKLTATADAKQLRQVLMTMALVGTEQELRDLFEAIAAWDGKRNG